MSEPSVEIEKLEKQLRQGDENALAKLFSIYHQRLWRIANFRMNNNLNKRLDPEDILQESYLEALKRIHYFTEDAFQSSFLWLRLIVHQTSIDIHRRHFGAQARDMRKEVAIEELRSPMSTTTSIAIQLVTSMTSPSQAASKHELMAHIETALSQMNSMDQEIIALRHFEELSNTEVASVLGIEQKTASIRYIRALRRLKSVLSNISGLF
ncbi:MAG: sigma-70 family RNA polymerase sigma factor [Desulfobacterales bacterium]|nr:sigma-70 family RNA polymerase sigma factor [Desulfobacterales bacterium]